MSGFYKLSDKQLLHAPNRVTLPGATLNRNPRADKALQEKAGWYWFDSRAEPEQHFGIQPAIENICTVPDCPERRQ